MNCSLNCAAVIPCLNEAAAIADVVQAVRKHVPTVFVIDDGSQDNTSLLAGRTGAEVLRNDRPFGKGAALKAGWKYAQERGFEWVLTMDGDGQHAAEDIPAFLDTVVRTGTELVVGNRMANPEGMPWLRRNVNRWMSARISKLAGLPLPDSQCGFRLMNLQAWSELSIKATGFDIESDVLVAFASGGYAIRFVPIRVIYKAEQSKIHPARDTIRWFRWWWTKRPTNGKLPACAGPEKQVSAARTG